MPNRSDTAARADALLRDAFTRRYRYRPTFPGWSAWCNFNDAGREHRALTAVSAAGDAEAVGDGPMLRADGEWLSQELRSLSRQLFGHDYETAEGRFPKSLDESPHPLGPLVVLHDDPHQATFRIRRRRITYATRRHATLLETVRVERWHVRPDGRWVPAQWTMQTWDDAIASPLRTDTYWDLYWPFGDELVPQFRQVDTVDDLGIRLHRELRFNDWRLAA